MEDEARKKFRGGDIQLIKKNWQLEFIFDLKKLQLQILVLLQEDI